MPGIQTAAPGARPSRVAVVTGGASGIGEAICHHLAERGHSVAVLDLDGPGAERVAKQLRSRRAGGQLSGAQVQGAQVQGAQVQGAEVAGADQARALARAVDVADRAAVDAAFAEVRSQLGPVDILVTSAGLCYFDAFDHITPERWDRMISVNLTGTFHCCQAALPDMVANRWGRIVTISSSSAQRGSPTMAHYAAAKGGVIVLTKSLARAYASAGITVNTIPPSGIETPMQHQSQAEGNLPANEVMAGTIPLGHLGTPDDIAAAAAFLASDEAGFITGQVLGVNGGSVL